MSKIKDNLIVLLILAVVVGIVVGLVASETIIGIIMTIKYTVGGQFIFFCVPLIIIGFITPFYYRT